MPAPSAEALILSMLEKPGSRSVNSQEKAINRSHVRRALLWNQSVPTFRVNVGQADLAARPKNTPSELETARAKIYEMRDWPAIACSGKWIDRDGKLLLAVWADHIVDHKFNGQVDQFSSIIFNNI